MCIRDRGYPRAQSVFSGNAIQNPTSLMIYLDGKPSNLISVNQLKFNWYNATKNGNDYVKNGDALGKNPTDVGDYIIEAVFAGDDNINAATSELGLTISKAQHANNGASIEVPLTVYPASGAYTYDVDIAKALENIPHGGGLELSPESYPDGTLNLPGLVKSAVWNKDNGKLNVTMKSLNGINPGKLGSIPLTLTSKNYRFVPVVVNITLQPKQEVQDISVSMEMCIRDSVRAGYSRLCKGLEQNTLTHQDYLWTERTLQFLIPQWWVEREDHRVLTSLLLKTQTLIRTTR